MGTVGSSDAGRKAGAEFARPKFGFWTYGYHDAQQAATHCRIITPRPLYMNLPSLVSKEDITPIWTLINSVEAKKRIKSLQRASPHQPPVKIDPISDSNVPKAMASSLYLMTTVNYAPWKAPPLADVRLKAPIHQTSPHCFEQKCTACLASLLHLPTEDFE